MNQKNQSEGPSTTNHKEKLDCNEENPKFRDELDELEEDFEVVIKKECELYQQLKKKDKELEQL